MNGKAHSLEPPIDVSALLASLELAGRKWPWSATARSCRAAHALALLADGDALEVVVAVGEADGSVDDWRQDVPVATSHRHGQIPRFRADARRGLQARRS